MINMTTLTAVTGFNHPLDGPIYTSSKIKIGMLAQEYIASSNLFTGGQHMVRRGDLLRSLVLTG